MKYLSLIVVILFFCSCSEEEKNNTKAFYYWKTNYNFSEQDKEMVKNLQVDKFYLRFFDVRINKSLGKAVPVGKLTFNNKKKYPYNYVPCVFITNDVIKKLTNEELKTLASNITGEIDYIARKINLSEQDSSLSAQSLYNEIQIDCDWSIKSKDKYFFFLENLQKIIPNKKITVTLRLWQLKNKKAAGIPPVDRVMLMCYSTGNPRNYDIDNSLANYKEIEKYVKGQSYPLQLDIALPIYSWAILFRNRTFKKIVRNFNFRDAQSDTSLFKHIKNNRYFVKKDTVMFDFYLRYGDELRLESFDKEEMYKLIKLLKSEDLKLNNSVISFFSWDSTYIKNHGYENINAYYNSFINN